MQINKITIGKNYILNPKNYYKIEDMVYESQLGVVVSCSKDEFLINSKTKNYAKMKRGDKRIESLKRDYLITTKPTAKQINFLKSFLEKNNIFVEGNWEDHTKADGELSEVTNETTKN